MKVKKLFWIVFVLIALFVVPSVMAAGSFEGESPEGFTLDAVSLFIVGLAVSGLSAFLLFVGDLFAKHKLETPNWIKQTAVYLVAYGLAFYFVPFAIPTFPTLTDDLGLNINLMLNDWFTPLFGILSGWFVIAHGFYKWFVKQLKDKAGVALGISGYKTTPTTKGAKG